MAYTLRETLTAIFDAPLSKEDAFRQITALSAEVQASGLNCFNQFLTTLTNWRDEILNYFHQRQTSGKYRCTSRAQASATTCTLPTPSPTSSSKTHPACWGSPR